jgi:NADH:ubiquinone oxidoreductase subunit D
VLEEVHVLVTGNRIFMDRMVGVGALGREETIAWGITGPLLRAAGVPFDLRKTQPYWAYDRIPFDIALGKNGDNFDRFLVRMAEMEQSMRFVEQALEGLPGGAIQVDWEGKAIDPPPTWMKGKQGKTEGLLLLPINRRPTCRGRIPAPMRVSTRKTSRWSCRRRRRLSARSKG